MAASSAFNSVSDKADKTVDSARDTVRKARDTVGHARDTFEEGRRSIPKAKHEARRAFDDGLDYARDQARDFADAAGEQLDTAKLYVVERVQERPFTATLAALGAGFVLGLLFAGGRR